MSCATNPNIQENDRYAYCRISAIQFAVDIKFTMLNTHYRKIG